MCGPHSSDSHQGHARAPTPSRHRAGLRFFDFDSYGHVDFKFFRVIIRDSGEHPELAGHEALIEVQYARVLLLDPSSRD